MDEVMGLARSPLRQDKWATWCQVGRAGPMLRREQLRNTMKRTTNAAGILLEESRVDSHERYLCSWYIMTILYTYQKLCENQN